MVPWPCATRCPRSSATSSTRPSMRTPADSTELERARIEHARCLADWERQAEADPGRLFTLHGLDAHVSIPHRWSGWPGAWCLDCGAEDPGELCIAAGHEPWTGCDVPEHQPSFCPEPGS